MNSYREVIYTLTSSQKSILLELSDSTISSSIEDQKVLTVLDILSQRGLAVCSFEESEYVSLGKFGKKYLREGLPEVQLLLKIKDTASTLQDLNISHEVLSSALREVKKKNLASFKKRNGKITLSITKEGRDFLKNRTNFLECFSAPVLKSDLSATQRDILEEFTLRKGFFKTQTKKLRTFSLTEKGRHIVKSLKENFRNLYLLELVTPKLLREGSWKGKEFRYYDINPPTQVCDVGREHPLFESLNILEEIFVEMGFKEMEGPIIESAFWNMDVLWIPQDHPARDEQDTFYLEGKAELPKSLFKKVGEMHEKGIYKSHTHVGEFSKHISSKRLLRTHSTPTTFRYLRDLGERNREGEDINGKYFYLAKVFRNEAVDATHLAEFFQGEGCIIGDNLSLSDLMGFITDYCKNLGLEKLKFKPTFNPYTEPSMEAHYYDENLKKWYSIINSGIFREETLKPFGLSGKTILAWGFGASRMASLLTKVQSMRELTGTTCDFKWIKERENIRRKIN